MFLNNQNQQRSHLYSWGNWFSLTNMMVGLFLFTIYWFADPMPSSIIGKLYMVIYSIGHAGFLFFLGYLLLAFPITALNKPQIAKPWASLVAALGLTLLFLDALIYSAYGYHLNFLSLDYIQNDFQLLTQSLPTGFKVAIVLVFIAIFAVELVLANALWRNLDKYRAFLLKIKLLPIVIGCFVLGHIGHIWADLSLYKPITRQDNQLPLSHPMTAKTMLSQSGLFDINEYQAKKQLTFDLSSYKVDVPNFQFSCFSPTTNFAVTLVESNQLPVEQISASIRQLDSEFAASQHWSPLNAQDSLFEIISGMPAIYQNQFAVMPNVLDSVLLSSGVNSQFTNLPNDTRQWLKGFESANRVSSFTVQYAYYQVNSESELAAIVEKAKQQIIIVHSGNAYEYGAMLVKGELVQLPNLTSNFDVLPTLLEGWLGCSFQTNYGKFGQNVFSVPRKNNWLVSADNEFIYVWHQDVLTKIDSDANMQSLQMGNQQIAQPPVNATLARAIQFLKRNLVEK
ncbi:Membrane-associated hydrolase of alkaline phosphatase superfamily protein [Catenovulum agarivorans DS-2]|uniref:Membrane-associated hydrolase of alkaline phosphatase superfamily protein n=1 Tax=Catenovulum agarivorans DS-2 TaxID=1328313 RepID=W7QKB0_9ALTE|nr:DUF3413 domain-containing protein [Catenovulum agarivorans]EWH08553.1 Membrane-associated hydrolase of alkaline phosphatase superfamily protein [Catenovulum agarivorans DS-2]